MTTKAQQITQVNSDWNQAPNDEPVLVLRASQWQEVLFMAVRGKFNKELHEKAQQMREYHLDNDIPF